jgi:hypothetical protein
VGPYESSAFANIVAEFILQFIASYYVGSTVKFAASHGYYKNMVVGADTEMVIGAQLMYGAAIFWLLSFILLTLWFIPTLCTLLLYYRGRFSNSKAVGPSRTALTPIGVASFFTAWIASWLFWAGYVHLAGDLYVHRSLSLHAKCLSFLDTAPQKSLPKELFGLYSLSLVYSLALEHRIKNKFVIIVELCRGQFCYS